MYYYVKYDVYTAGAMFYVPDEEDNPKVSV